MNKVYALSDLHGNYNLWEQISSFCDSSDKIFYLGDAIDRGKDNLLTLTSLLIDKRVTFLLGNHEEYLLNYLEKMSKMNNIEWFYNGGEQTFKECGLLSDLEREYLIDSLKNCSLYYVYTNKNNQKILLSHAGCNLKADCDLKKVRKEDFLWSRDHFHKKWNFKDHANLYMVHGHTPVQVLQESFFNKKILKDEVIKYAEGHKFDIDLGSFFSKKAALLDLDTFKIEYFKEKEQKEL